MSGKPDVKNCRVVSRMHGKTAVETGLFFVYVLCTDFQCIKKRSFKTLLQHQSHFSFPLKKGYSEGEMLSISDDVKKKCFISSMVRENANATALSMSSGNTFWPLFTCCDGPKQVSTLK